MFLPSSDGVEVAVHSLGGNGPDHLLISHATGFHGRAYVTLANSLADRFHSVAFDYRAHGDTRTPNPAATQYDWEHFADDALAVARVVREQADRALVGFGHSMGGAALLMAAHRDPTLFRAAILFEPIVFPDELMRQRLTPNPLAVGARKRRSSFPSYAAALENFGSKPPLNAFPREALEAYVLHGFAEGEDGQVHLKCTPEGEAATFEGSGTHNTWELLPEIEMPVLVLAGEAEADFGPALVAPQVAERLPNGRYEGHPEIDHFGPMTHPDEIAQLITGFVDSAS